MRIRIYPPFSACLTFSAGLFGGLAAILALFAVIAQLRRGRLIALPPGDTVMRMLIALGTVTLALALFLFALFWIAAVTLDERGLRGPTIWGRRINIDWNDVASARRVVVRGLPALLIQSRSTKKEIWLYSLGLNGRTLYNQVRAFVAPSHPLASWLTATYRINE